MIKEHIQDIGQQYLQQISADHARILQTYRDHFDGFVSQEELGQPPPLDELQRLRLQRNRLLQRSDWTQTDDALENMTPEWRQRWKAFRQALRDLPQQYEANNGQIEWPKP